MTTLIPQNHCTISPGYFDSFSCLAADCPDTCCKGWIIEIDPEAEKNWLAMSAEDYHTKLDKKPSDYIDTIPLKNGSHRCQIRMDENMKCPFLTENELCSIVIHEGHPMTTRICRDYPRSYEDFDHVSYKSLSIRCAPVLDQLWKLDTFQYQITGEISDKVLFPAKELLDGCLSVISKNPAASELYLFALFASFFRMHKRLELTIPLDDAGFRDYGQEFITSENTKEVLDTLNSILSGEESPVSSPVPLQGLLPLWHDMMYEVMQNFFDSPVFGPEFHALFHDSQNLIAENDLNINQYQSSVNMDIDKKLFLVIQEELFSSVLSPDVSDYETILVRLQWLIQQYLVVRYLLLIDTAFGRAITNDRLKHHISRIFRVTDLPDIMKIAFFDSGFTNWLWSEEVIHLHLITTTE